VVAQFEITIIKYVRLGLSKSFGMFILYHFPQAQADGISNFNTTFRHPYRVPATVYHNRMISYFSKKSVTLMIIRFK